MDNKHQQDIAFTHSFLNYLTAAYQGRFAALNILQQLAFHGLSTEEIGRTRAALEKVRRWVVELSNQACLFSSSWTTPETFEAQNAYKLLEDIKPELQQTAEAVLTILADAGTPDNPQAVKFLIAAYGRYAYSRDNYVKGSIDYAKHFGYTDMAEQFGEVHKASALDVETAHNFLNVYKARTQVNDAFFRALFDECLPLPAVFRTHTHDINLLLAPYKGGVSFEVLDFFGPEIMQWKSLNFDAANAGYWRAYGFGAEEAADWLQTGLQAPAAAFDWKSRGIGFQDAAPWVQNNFSANVAARWLNAGFNCDQAVHYINRGVNDPEVAKKG